MKKNSTKNVNRRDFLKAAGVATAAAATVGVTRPGYVAEGGPIKVGLIGCGGRGNSAARNAMTAGDRLGVDVRIVAVADVFQERAKSEQGRLGRKSAIKDDMVFSGLDCHKKLCAQDLTYVILATPPGFRPMHFEEVVNKKLHCFCEKPVATDPVNMRQFMAAAKKAEDLKLSVTTGTQRRHENAYIETIKKIHDGEIGKILAARCYWCGGPVFKARDRNPDWSDLEWQLRAWYSYCWICGDNIVEQHVHNLDVINWAIGRHPKSAFASGGRSWKDGHKGVGDILDHFSVDYDYGDGVHMLSMCRHWNNASGAGGESVAGTKRYSNCRDMAGGGDGYVNEHINLIKSIIDQGPHYNEAMQVAESTFTAILGREAAYSGQRLGWDQLLNADLNIMPKNMSLDKSAKNPEPPVPRPGTSDKSLLRDLKLKKG